jgi:hypothetical protein
MPGFFSIALESPPPSDMQLEQAFRLAGGGASFNDSKKSIVLKFLFFPCPAVYDFMSHSTFGSLNRRIRGLCAV